MSDSDSATIAIQDFIARWQPSGAAERANFQPFIGELCHLLALAPPDPAGPRSEQNAYAFERAVTFHNRDGSTSPGFIDLYKRGCFVMEAKQGSDRTRADAATGQGDAQAGLFAKDTSKPARKGAAVRGTRAWDTRMLEARGQAESYVRALPADEGNPPFILVVDVGNTIETYSDFSRAGKTYVPFPDARSHRLRLDQLADPAARDRLRAIWTDPMQLDPSRLSARVTRDVAARLARLATSLEASGHAPSAVAAFLMRAIFTMFAEDVQLIPAGRFTALLEEIRTRPAIFPDMLRSLWQTMNTGGFSPALKETLLRFNGGLFEQSDALPVTAEQLELLIEASHADWRDVEPAIFGTLLERALDAVERHKLGAHYTPRAYVERLVMPTIIEPLREDWEAVKVAAKVAGDSGRSEVAAAEVLSFHQRLCNTRVLDPACGSGNFLYVTLEHLKRLEGEVLDTLHEFGEQQMPLMTVDPHQLLGIEVNPRAAAIADLVLWIGYLQWHFRTRGEAMPAEPVLQNFHNIECRDAVLAYDRVEQVTDEQGRAVTRWDGRTMKRHAVTGEDVPDDAARVPLLQYVNPRKADWPAAEFIIGNPPFIGARRIRLALGHEYVEALRETYSELPETIDFVTYWWHKAALTVQEGKARRFGLITTNSIVQSYSRGVIEKHLSAKEGIRLIFAVPDHPWVETADGAAVRIAMTVGVSQSGYQGLARLGRVVEESPETERVILDEQNVALISASLQADIDTRSLQPLQASEDLCFQGVVPAGDGFKLTPTELEAFNYSPENLPQAIKKYIIGRDLVQRHQPKFIIDFFGLSESDARKQWPRLYQRLLDRVYPERRQNNRAVYRDKWWIFAEPRPAIRRALADLKRFIVTPNTAKFRTFQFIDAEFLPDTTVYAVASDDAFLLGILSSYAHMCWSLAAGGTLEDRPRYNSKGTFVPFPFPICDEEQKARIRALGEQLDAHRKRQQALHPQLTITEMYNVLDKLRTAATLSDKERLIHEQGLVSVLKQLHDELDREVSRAYGWPDALTDDEILERLVHLNRERADEERRGIIRWLRPEFQNPQRATQAAFAADDTAAAPVTRAAKAERAAWPKSLAEQARAVRSLLAAQPAAVNATQLARQFKAARVDQVAKLLETLAALGQARKDEAGRFVA